MTMIVPAVLTKNPDEFQEKLEFLESIQKIMDIHLDIADGEFVTNHTFLPKELGKINSRIKVEAHMMVKNPQYYFHDLEYAGVKMVSIHYESFFRLSDLETALKNAKFLGFETGLFLNPETEVSVVDSLADNLDVLALMSVHPGYQGQKFVPESYDRLELLRKKHPHALIEIDGGINLDNFSSIKEHRPDRIVIGSGIWQTKDVKQRIQEFFERLK